MHRHAHTNKMKHEPASAVPKIRRRIYTLQQNWCARQARSQAHPALQTNQLQNYCSAEKNKLAQVWARTAYRSKVWARTAYGSPRSSVVCQNTTTRVDHKTVATAQSKQTKGGRPFSCSAVGHKCGLRREPEMLERKREKKREEEEKGVCVCVGGGVRSVQYSALCRTAGGKTAAQYTQDNCKRNVSPPAA